MTVLALAAGCGDDGSDNDNAGDSNADTQSDDQADDQAEDDGGSGEDSGDSQADEADEADDGGSAGAACELFTAEEISAVAGEDLTIDEASTTDNDCTYLSPAGSSVGISIETAGDQVALDLVGESFGGEPVDIGDGGYVYNIIAEQVVFLLGDSLYYVSVFSLTSDAREIALDVAEQLVDRV